MNVLSAQGLGHTHGIKELFRDVSLGVEDDDRIAVIGANGSGKSTLLKILSGEEKPDRGQVTIRQGIRVEYAPQNPTFDPNHTVLQHIFYSHTEVAEVVGEYEIVTHALAANPDDLAILRRMEELSARMDALQAWEFEDRARVVLGQLGVHDLELKLGALSGGYRKRVALARALLADAELLILDEPTNHLDADTTAWLEGYLRRMPHALLVVTHDRYFLDRVAKRIIEIDNGTLLNYAGNFSYYLERKAEQQAAEVRNDERRRSLLRKELDWLSRGARARRTKEKHRIERIGDMQAAITPRAKDPLVFQAGTRRIGSKTIEFEDVSKSLGGRQVINAFTYTIAPGERMGIIGPNGAGKTTLVNLMTGKLKPDSGSIGIGETIHFGLFDQESGDLRPEERAIDYVKREGGEMLKAPDGAVLTAERMMERFLFTPQMLYQSIDKLSGGERRRLHLVRTLMLDPNFLILDEPTNDLDIPTLQALEDFLDQFNGCLVVVSHDRYFLDRTVDHLIAVEPGGNLRNYPGDYSLYERMKAERELAAAPGKGPAHPAAQATPAEVPAERKKLTFNEQRELAKLEEDIPTWEDRLKALDDEMAGAATDYLRLKELTEEQTRLKQQVETAVERWEHLASRS